MEPESRTCVVLVDSDPEKDPAWLKDHGEEKKEGSLCRVHY